MYVFVLVKSQQLIFEITAAYRFISQLSADNWLICWLRAQDMISKSNAKSVRSVRRFICRYIFQNMYNKTIIRFGFCDMRNNQDLNKCYQSRPSAPPIELDCSVYLTDFIQQSFIKERVLL